MSKVKDGSSAINEGRASSFIGFLRVCCRALLNSYDRELKQELYEDCKAHGFLASDSDQDYSSELDARGLEWMRAIMENWYFTPDNQTKREALHVCLDAVEGVAGECYRTLAGASFKFQDDENLIIESLRELISEAAILYYSGELRAASESINGSFYPVVRYRRANGAFGVYEPFAQHSKERLFSVADFCFRNGLGGLFAEAVHLSLPADET